MHEAKAVTIRIGGLVEHESERSTLREVEQLLEADGRRAIVFANFEVGGRQVDLLVALDDLALVIEAKGFTRAVRGGKNGPWEVHLGSGHWKEFPNPYRQALGAALAVKDAVRAFSGNGAPYVHAALVFSPDFPSGSGAFRGNRNVSVIGKTGLGPVLGRSVQGAWSLVRWAEFADHLGLAHASSVTVACDSGLAAAEDRLQQYVSMFRRTYTDADSLVPFLCESNEVDVSSSEVIRAVTDVGGSVLLQGPSGCGKTMLALSSGTAFTERGGIPIVIQAKDFVGRARQLLQGEASLLGMPSAMQLLKDARRLERPIVLVVDGYNECGSDLRQLLTRVVAALSYRYETGVLVTSQIPLEREALLNLRKVEVRAPSIETKLAIARQSGEGRASSEALEPLLSAVSTACR